MEDRFLQQLKKGILELLVLDSVCQAPSYGYELLTTLAERTHGLFLLKEGTLYPILYRLEDDGLIQSTWSQGEGRKAPKKIYTVTAPGMEELSRRKDLWTYFSETVTHYLSEE